MWNNNPWRSRRTSVLQGTLLFVVFTTHLGTGMGAPWNKTAYKIELQCRDFHAENASKYFYYWPEDDFNYCCSIGENVTVPYGTKNESFTYGARGPSLQNGMYFDLGPIDDCLPYWKVGCLLRRLYETQLWMIECEFTDLRSLYRRRFWTGTVLNYGLLQSALPLILFLEVLVMPFAALYWLIWGRPGHTLKQVFTVSTIRDWFRATRKTLLVDWVHLWLLAMIGNGLIDAVGHQNPYSPESEAFYNYSLLYIGLTILVWAASFLQQLSYWVSQIEDHCADHGLPTHEVLRKESHLAHRTSESMKLKERVGLNADWKLQPIGAQAGILFCLWAFLTNVGSDGQGLFGLVVAAAGPWSGLYAFRVIGTCIYFLVRLRLSIAEKRRQRIRRLWRRVVHVRKWRPGGRGNGGEAELGDIARSEEPTALLAEDERNQRV